MIFQVLSETLMQMQAFNDSACVSRFNACLHVHWNLYKQLNDHDHGLMEYYLKWSFKTLEKYLQQEFSAYIILHHPQKVDLSADPLR